MGSAKADLYRYVNNLRNRLGIDLDDYPINTVSLCDKMENVKVLHHKFNTNGFCGAVLIGDKSDTIVLNSNRSEYEQNFDCGHELIHMTRHRNKNIDCFSCMELKIEREPKVRFLEWEANEGAAEIIVPMCSLLPKIKKAYPRLKKALDYGLLKIKLSKAFNVPNAVINFRLESLKYEIFQYLSGKEINEIEILSKKEQEKKKIHVKSFNEIEAELIEKERYIPWKLNLNNLDIYGE